MAAKLLEGRLLLYSETGMEGGYLSIQDKAFIKLGSPRFGVSDGNKVWEKNDISRFGLASNTEVLIENVWLQFPDPIWKDKDFEISSLCRGEQNGDLNADKRLAEKYKFKVKYSVERLNDAYGPGNWKIVDKLPKVVLKDGTVVHFGDIPDTIPSRPYGISQDGKTRVSVKWNDGSTEHQILSDNLLVENWDTKGLHFLRNEDTLKVIDQATRQIICEGQLDKIPLNIFSQTKQGHFEQDNSRMWEQYFSGNYCAELHR